MDYDLSNPCLTYDTLMKKNLTKIYDDSYPIPKS